jgi:hypothetical protein
MGALSRLHRRATLEPRVGALAGLEPATCCLGDDCPSSALCGPLGSGQVSLADVSVQRGVVRSGTDWWNVHQNDHLSKQRGCFTAPLRSPRARPQGIQACWTSGWGESRCGRRPRPDKRPAQTSRRPGLSRTLLIPVLKISIRASMSAGMAKPAGQPTPLSNTGAKWILGGNSVNDDSVPATVPRHSTPKSRRGRARSLLAPQDDGRLCACGSAPW